MIEHGLSVTSKEMRHVYEIGKDLHVCPAYEKHKMKSAFNINQHLQQLVVMACPATLQFSLVN